MGLDWHRMRPREGGTKPDLMDTPSVEFFTPRDFHQIKWLRNRYIGTDFRADIYLDRSPEEAFALSEQLEDVVEKYLSHRHDWLEEWMELRIDPGGPYYMEVLEEYQLKHAEWDAEEDDEPCEEELFAMLLPEAEEARYDALGPVDQDGVEYIREAAKFCLNCFENGHWLLTCY